MALEKNPVVYGKSFFKMRKVFLTLAEKIASESQPTTLHLLFLRGLVAFFFFILFS